jgi:hypothetical protein
MPRKTGKLDLRKVTKENIGMTLFDHSCSLIDKVKEVKFEEFDLLLNEISSARYSLKSLEEKIWKLREGCIEDMRILGINIMELADKQQKMLDKEIEKGKT